MADVEVVEVESKAQMRRFIDYPNQLYKNDPNYVAPLTMERNEFFDIPKNPFYRKATVKFFLAMRGDEVVGRVATCVNYVHNEFHQEKTGFFGFLDTPDDADIAARLLKVAMITLKIEGMERMRGPMNFSTNHETGFLIEGFDTPPTIMMTYNKPYQPAVAEKFGLKKVMDLLAYRLTKEKMQIDRFKPVAERIQKRAEITVRNIRMSDFDNEVKRINEIYNQAWSHNWGFVPMDEAEFEYMAKNLKQVVEPELVLMAEHKGKPIAFSLALPDINQALIHLHGSLFPFGIVKLLWHTKIRNKITDIRVLTLGVIPEFQKRGIDACLYMKTAEAGIAKGYNGGEFSWILETNDLMRGALEQLGAWVDKRYRVYEMPL